MPSCQIHRTTALSVPEHRSTIYYPLYSLLIALGCSAAAPTLLSSCVKTNQRVRGTVQLYQVEEHAHLFTVYRRKMDEQSMLERHITIFYIYLSMRKKKMGKTSLWKRVSSERDPHKPDERETKL